MIRSRATSDRRDGGRKKRLLFGIEIHLTGLQVGVGQIKNVGDQEVSFENDVPVRLKRHRVRSPQSWNS